MEKPDTTPSPWLTLRTGVLQSLAVFAGAVTAWGLWWAWCAHSLSAHMIAYASRHEPSSVADLLGPPLAPQDNAVTQIMNLSHDILYSGPGQMAAYPLSPEQLERLRGIVTRVPSPIKQLESLRTANDARWPFDPRHVLAMDTGSGLLEYGDTREFYRLIQFIHDASLYFHQVQQDDEAVECLLDLLVCTRIADKGKFLYNHQFAAEATYLACDALFKIAPELQIQIGGRTDGASGKTLEELRNGFLKVDDLQAGLRQCLMTLRVRADLLANTDADGSWFLRPMLRLDAARWLDAADSAIEALRGPAILPYPELERKLPQKILHAPNFEAATAMVANDMPPGNSQENLSAIELHYAVVALSRAAGVRLGIRAYEIEHGVLPKTLATLMPGYMPALPADPFRQDGQTFRYDPARKVLYSVGQNGVDDGGVIQGPWRTPLISERDLIIRLNTPGQ